MNQLPTLSLIVPCYNESEMLDICSETLSSLLTDLQEKQKISSGSHILFVDDGSTDDTWERVYRKAKKSSMIKGLKLSRNKGHQVALFAGLSKVDTDITISLDADLQDDIFVIEDMIEKYNQGCDIVYGVRSSRNRDSFFKKCSARVFYWLLNSLNVEQIKDHADFRLLSRRALKSLISYQETNIYLRGLIPQLGFKSDSVFYERKTRIEGDSKYSLHKMLSLALTAITSTSVTPLRLISFLGFIISLISAYGIIEVIYAKFTGATVDGWSSLMIAIFFLGGVQMLSIGVIGEYVGRIYMETKKRPKYFIDKEI